MATTLAAVPLRVSPIRGLRLFSTSLSSLLSPHKHKHKHKDNKNNRSKQQESTKSDDFKPKQRSFFAPQPSTWLATQRRSLFDARGPRKRDPHPTLYVYGLNKCTNTEGLREAFSKFGKVDNAKIIRDNVFRNSRGFGYVKYSTTEEAAKGLKGMDEKLLDGWVVFAEYAKRHAKPPKKNRLIQPQDNAKLPNQHSKKEQERTKRFMTTLNRLRNAKKRILAVRKRTVQTNLKSMQRVE